MTYFLFLFRRMSCEQATGLEGNLFTVRYMLKYPPMCRSSDCEKQYLKKIQNSIRKNHRRIPVTMSFTNGEIRTVQLAFCSFSMTGNVSIPFLRKTNGLEDQSIPIFRYQYSIRLYIRYIDIHLSTGSRQ